MEGQRLQWVEEADLNECGETLGARQRLPGQRHGEALYTWEGMGEA